MSDLVFVVTVVTFFFALALLVRACGRITAGAHDDPEGDGAFEPGTESGPEAGPEPGMPV